MNTSAVSLAGKFYRANKEKDKLKKTVIDLGSNFGIFAVIFLLVLLIEKM